MTKKTLALIVAVLFVGFFAAGCALFETNVRLDNALTVARIRTGDSARRYIEINKRQLREAYNNWGFQFVTQQNMSPQEAVRETLNVLIEREILVHLSMQDQFFGTHGQGYRDALTPHEAGLARRNAFQSFDSSIAQIHTQVRRDRGFEDNETAPDPEPMGEPVFTPFEHYILTQGTGPGRTFSLNIERFENDEDFGPDRDGNDRVPQVAEYLANRAFAPRNDSEIEVSMMLETRTRIVRLLRNAERGLNYSGSQNTDDAVLTRELNRIIREEEKTILIGRFRDMFEQGMMSAGRDYFKIFHDRNQSTENLHLWRETIAERSQAHVNDLAERARAHMRREIRLAKDRLEKGIDTFDSIGSQIIQGLEGIFYVPGEIIHQYFTVSHILVGFSEQERNAMTQLRTELNQGRLTPDEYTDRIREFRDQLRIAERDHQTGLETGRMLSAREVHDIVEHAVNPRGNQPAQLKIDAFHEMIYRFNSDSGMQNPVFEYTMGIEVRERDPQTGEFIGEDRNSRMVEPFTRAARELHNFVGNPFGGRPQFDPATGNGRPGAMSDLVWSEFGAHIIMYTRPLSEFIFSNSLTIFDTPFGHEQFLFATQTSYGNRTQFDAIIEQMQRHAYSDAERAVVRAFKIQHVGNNGITIFERHFRDLWED